MTTYLTDRDRNGNRIVRVTIPGSRPFTIQTSGNLPETHRHGICPATAGEVKDYVIQFGTARQRELLGIWIETQNAIARQCAKAGRANP